jgi:nicotinamidase-related amidase
VAGLIAGHLRGHAARAAPASARRLPEDGMALMEAARSRLLVIDFQDRLMPAIRDGEAVLAQARRLLEAARLLAVPVLVTEQSPAKLGRTVAGLGWSGPVVEKTSFDSGAAPAFQAAVAGDEDLVVCGCESHVCVLQTVLGLLAQGRRVRLVQDAVGSRAAESKAVALERLARHGADIVTTEMVLFEWLRDAGHPQFRAVSQLIR